MCGIIGHISRTPSKKVNGSIIHQYIKQRDRGTEGFGFAFVNEHQRVCMRKATTEYSILDLLTQNPSSAMIFHHRLPTSTKNVKQACHPFKVKVNNRNFYLVHNGIIYNADELELKHRKKNYIYSSYVLDEKSEAVFNDSEALAHDVAFFLAGKQKKIKSEGMIAFIVMETDDQNKLLKVHFARNSTAPLKFLCTKNDLLVGSECYGTEAKEDTLYTFDYSTGLLTIRNIKIPSHRFYSEGTTYGGSNYAFSDGYGGYYREEDGYYYRRSSKNREQWREDFGYDYDETPDFSGLSDAELEGERTEANSAIQALEVAGDVGRRTNEQENELSYWYWYIDCVDAEKIVRDELKTAEEKAEEEKEIKQLTLGESEQK